MNKEDSHLETVHVRSKDGCHPDTYSDHSLATVQVLPPTGTGEEMT